MQGELTTPWLVVYGYKDSITAYPWMLVFTHLAFRKKQQVATKSENAGDNYRKTLMVED